jgi:hypothetical protein
VNERQLPLLAVTETLPVPCDETGIIVGLTVEGTMVKRAAIVLHVTNNREAVMTPPRIHLRARFFIFFS